MTTLKQRKEFEADIFTLLVRINEALPAPPSDLAMFALALALKERIAIENDDPEEREACFNVMMAIVQASALNEEKKT